MVVLPMTISGTVSESVFPFKSSVGVLRRVLSVSCDRVMTCDSEMAMDRELGIQNVCLPRTEGKTVVDLAVVVAPGAAAGVDCWRDSDQH